MSLPTIVATDTDEMAGAVAGALSASVQAGDLLVVFGGDNDDGSGTAEFTPSDDQSNSYVAVGNALNSGLANPSSAVFRAFAGSTGTVNITMAHTNEGDAVAACGLIVFRGVDPTTPIPHVTDLGEWTGAGNSFTVPAAGSLNITTNDCIVVAFMNSQAGSRTFSGGITWGNTLANTGSLALKTNWRMVFYGEQATAATQTATVADDETDASRYTGHLFAVAGAAGGGGGGGNGVTSKVTARPGSIAGLGGGIAGFLRAQAGLWVPRPTKIIRPRLVPGFARQGA